jgi:hypothetical protein
MATRLFGYAKLSRAYEVRPIPYLVLPLGERKVGSPQDTEEHAFKLTFIRCPRSTSHLEKTMKSARTFAPTRAQRDESRM